MTTRVPQHPRISRRTAVQAGAVGLLGLGMGSLGSFVLVWLAYVKYFQHEGIADRPLLQLGILLVFAGVQLVTLGLLAEMQARTYHESQDKPIYVIREIRESVASGPDRARELITY